LKPRRTEYIASVEDIGIWPTSELAPRIRCIEINTPDRLYSRTVHVLQGTRP